MPQSFTKDPESQGPYQIDWSAWLPEGDTIVTSEWEVDAAMTVIEHLFTGTTTTLWIVGGTLGCQYRARNMITTSGNPAQIEPRSIYFAIAER